MAADGGLDREYVAAISNTLDYIQRHLDEDLSPGRLAKVACFSQHHFHRIFRAVVGESVMDHVRRLRLERAAHTLKTRDRSISQVAFEAGYRAQEAFTRVFQTYFGVAPSAYRAAGVSHVIPAPCGVHFEPSGFTALRLRMISFDDTCLCPVHRDFAEQFEERWEALLAALTGFASYVYPPTASWRSGDLEGRMTGTTMDIDKEIESIEQEIEAARQRLGEARRRRPREQVKDYVLKDSEGNDVYLSELFGNKEDLILIHNMGTGCVYCTMWADGFTGLAPHLSNRAAFVVCSPDKPEVQKRFAEKRNWNFKMVSAADTTFFQDMGFWQTEGPHPGPWPGVSTFKRDPDGRIYRIAKASFGPNDDFCATWPLLDMLEEGVNEWEPQYSY